MTPADPADVRRLEIDQAPATPEQLARRVLDGFGHFTAMQVRGGRVRGLAEHLDRLDTATRELFDQGLDGARVRAAVRHALAGAEQDASVRVYVHAPDGEPSLMVTVRPPVELPGALAERAQALMSVPYVRPVAHLKHLGGFGQSYHRREAQRAGFDEALLTGPDGLISEGAVTNVVFFDGHGAVWPDGPRLSGITLRLLEPLFAGTGLPSRRGPVFLRDLGAYRAAFVMNSWGVSPVRRVDDRDFPVDEKLAATVAGLYEGVPWDEI
ncbi:aminotransferase class IV [Streptomyces sp. PmtG]